MDATDYTKRKHVFKLLSRVHSSTATVGQTEILVQAENDSQMSVWRDLLQSVCDPNSLLKKVSGSLVKMANIYSDNDKNGVSVSIGNLRFNIFCVDVKILILVFFSVLLLDK